MFVKWKVEVGHGKEEEARSSHETTDSLSLANGFPPAGTRLNTMGSQHPCHPLPSKNKDAGDCGHCYSSFTSRDPPASSLSTASSLVERSTSAGQAQLQALPAWASPVERQHTSLVYSSSSCGGDSRSATQKPLNSLLSLSRASFSRALDVTFAVGRSRSFPRYENAQEVDENSSVCFRAASSTPEFASPQRSPGSFHSSKGRLASLRTRLGHVPSRSAEIHRITGESREFADSAVRLRYLGNKDDASAWGRRDQECWGETRHRASRPALPERAERRGSNVRDDDWQRLRSANDEEVRPGKSLLLSASTKNRSPSWNVCRSRSLRSVLSAKENGESTSSEITAWRRDWKGTRAEGASEEEGRGRNGGRIVELKRIKECSAERSFQREGDEGWGIRHHDSAKSGIHLSRHSTRSQQRMRHVRRAERPHGAVKRRESSDERIHSRLRGSIKLYSHPVDGAASSGLGSDGSTRLHQAGHRRSLRGERTLKLDSRRRGRETKEYGSDFFGETSADGFESPCKHTGGDDACKKLAAGKLEEVCGTDDSITAEDGRPESEQQASRSGTSSLKSNSRSHRSLGVAPLREDSRSQVFALGDSSSAPCSSYFSTSFDSFRNCVGEPFRRPLSENGIVWFGWPLESAVCEDEQRELGMLRRSQSAPLHSATLQSASSSNFHTSSEILISRCSTGPGWSSSDLCPRYFSTMPSCNGKFSTHGKAQLAFWQTKAIQELSMAVKAVESEELWRATRLIRRTLFDLEGRDRDYSLTSSRFDVGTFASDWRPRISFE